MTQVQVCHVFEKKNLKNQTKQFCAAYLFMDGEQSERDFMATSKRKGRRFKFSPLKVTGASFLKPIIWKILTKSSDSEGRSLSMKSFKLRDPESWIKLD